MLETLSADEDRAALAANQVGFLKRVFVAEVERHKGVVVSGYDAESEPVRSEMSGPGARMMQYEIDHLDGVLMLDRTDLESRKRAMRQWRERLLAGGRAP